MLSRKVRGSHDVLSFSFFLYDDHCNYQGHIPTLVPFPSPQHNFHVHSHLWPQLKFMKSPQCWGLLGWRPSQERNELIVTLRLLLSISELSTAVDRRCPGPRPSITGPHHQETKQITVSQMYSPESTRVRQNIQKQTGKKPWLNFRIQKPNKTEVWCSCWLKRSKVQQCVKFVCRYW